MPAIVRAYLSLRRLRARVIAFAVLLILALPTGERQMIGAVAARDRILRSVGEVHALSAETSARHLPVLLQAVVTYSDVEHFKLFVEDATGGTYVATPRDIKPQPEAGDLIEVEGVTGPGDYASVVVGSRLRLMRRGTLRLPAPRVSMAQLMTGTYDSRLVEISGVIHTVLLAERDVTIRVAMADGIVAASTVRRKGVDYSRLANARVLLRATAGAVFNGRRQLVGAMLLFPSLSSLQIVETGPAAPFSLAVEPIATLSLYNPARSMGKPVHLRGRVTLLWPDSLLCLKDASGDLCAFTAATGDARLGGVADIVGFPAHGETAPILTDAVARAANATGYNEESALTGDGVLSVENDARVVRLDGEVMGSNDMAGYTTLMVSSGASVNEVLLPKALGNGSAGWKTGSFLRLTGICSVQLDPVQSARMGGKAVPKGYRLLLRSTRDVVVLRRPTWWTPVHSTLVVGAVLGLALLLVAWTTVLRQTVERQTKTIRESEARFRHMAQHDALTGLPTRTLLYERLHEALARCKDHANGLALLMVDLDHFKAVNDTFGHDAGDEMLRVTAERMRCATRPGDTVARVGGDEFLVLLADLPELGLAQEIAAELVEALCRPVRLGEREIPVSASVGVCSTLDEHTDMQELLRNVDAAMYRAKAHGRNRFQFATPFVTASTV